MFWTFVATIFSGLGAAGIALGIRALTRKKAPKWIIPVFAGVGMLAYLVHGEYNWFEHKQTLKNAKRAVLSRRHNGDAWPVLWRRAARSNPCSLIKL